MDGQTMFVQLKRGGESMLVNVARIESVTSAEASEMSPGRKSIVWLLRSSECASWLDCDQTVDEVAAILRGEVAE